MEGALKARAEEYAAGQYVARGATCLHMGGMGGYCFSHSHETAAAAAECTAERRAACVGRIVANGGHSEL